MQLGTDNFSRIVSSGPGTSSDGQVWSVNAGTGSHYSVSTNQLHYSYDSLIYGKLLLGYGVSQDFNFLARFTPGSNSDLFGFFFRYVTSNDNVAAGINTIGQYYVTAFSGGTEYDYTGSSVTVTANTPAWVRVSTSGSQVQIKYWLDGTTEPTAWGYTVTIAPAAWYGQYGLIERVGTAATSILTDSYLATNNTTTNLSTLSAYIYPGSPLVSGVSDVPSELADGRRIDIARPEYYRVGDGTSYTSPSGGTTPGQLYQMLVSQYGNDAYSSSNLSLLKQYAKQVFVTVSGVERYSGPTRTAISSLANNSSLLTNFSNNLVTFCSQNGVTGVDLDLELFGGWSQAGSATTFTQLKTIATSLGNALHAAGLKLMIDGPTFTSQGAINWVWSDFNNLPVDYFNIQAYDHFFDTVTGGSTAGGPDYALAPAAWMAQVIAFMKTQVSNINQLVVAVTNESYFTPNGTTNATEATNIGTAQGWPGYSTAVRDKASGEFIWTSGGNTYVYCDYVTINQKFMVCFDNGVSNIAIWSMGDKSEWPTVLPTTSGGGGGGSGGTGTTQVNVTITNAGLNLIRDAMINSSISSLVTYAAIGTGTSTPAVTDTSLANEVFRKQITGRAKGANVGECIITMYLSQADAINTNVQEFGFFGGAATGTANSGTLIARGLYNHTHTNQETLTFNLDITV